MMALVVQLLSMCYKLLKKVSWFFCIQLCLMENDSVCTSHFEVCFQSTAQANCLTAFLQVENNQWVSTANKDTMDGKT